MSDNFLRVSGGLNLAKHDTDPANPVEGDMYYNSTSDTIRVYQNGAWVSLDTTADEGITQLTGDVTALGPGIAVATLATVPIAKGGTGQITADAAFNALSPMSALGDLIYGGVLGHASRLAAGANGQFLTLSGGVPAWGASDGGITQLTGDITAGPGSGSQAATIAAGAVTDAKVAANAAIVYSKLSLSNSILNTDINASAAISFSKLAALPSSQILVGNGSSVATAVTVTGDISLSNTGVATIAAGAVNNSKVAAGAAIVYSKLSLSNSIVNADINSIAAIVYSKLSLANSIVNTDINNSAAIAFSKLAALTSGQILVGDGSSVATAVAVTGDISLSNAGVTAYAGVVPIAKGGTNNSAPLAGSRIMVSSLSAIAEAPALTNGQLLIGATSGTPTAAAITGTANQVIVTNGPGSITLSAPQNINSTASPTFIGLTLSGLTQGSVPFSGASGVILQNNANFFWNNANLRLGIRTSTPQSSLDVNGNSIFRGSISYQDAAAVPANYQMFQANVFTTDNTVTTLVAVPTVTDSTMYLTAHIIARRTGGSAGAVGDGAVYKREAFIKNIAGVVTIETLQTSYTSEDQNQWNATFIVSGSNILISVLGQVGNNINWSTTYFTQFVT